MDSRRRKHDDDDHHEQQQQPIKGQKKGAWSAGEDAILFAYVHRHGDRNWKSVQKQSGLARCAKSCRLRWVNHLHPNLKKESLSREEQRIIIALHRKFGNKWALMATQLPGRTDNEIKNFWNTRMHRCRRAGLPVYPPDSPAETHEKTGGFTSNSQPELHGNQLEQHGNRWNPQFQDTSFTTLLQKADEHTDHIIHSEVEISANTSCSEISVQTNGSPNVNNADQPSFVLLFPPEINPSDKRGLLLARCPQGYTDQGATKSAFSPAIPTLAADHICQNHIAGHSDTPLCLPQSVMTGSRQPDAVSCSGLKWEFIRANNVLNAAGFYPDDQVTKPAAYKFVPGFFTSALSYGFPIPTPRQENIQYACVQDMGTSDHCLDQAHEWNNTQPSVYNVDHGTYSIFNRNATTPAAQHQIKR